MAKIALLIGVSRYDTGFLTHLSCAERDAEAMRRVLQHPEIGGFDEVQLLSNPEPQPMQEAIENVFSGRNKDDLVLLYFSGHGVKDENNKLYFATPKTRRNSTGGLVVATTVQARFVHDMMSNSHSRRQVVILDCCFSGAFSNGMLARDDGFVNVRQELGGEGRAVLTSSTSTQYSFEQQGEHLSIYTRYIIEGLETGAADRDRNGQISVDELHEYAKSKVQEEAPVMTPEIYAIREGYRIQLAQAPINDPKLIYRQEVKYWVKNGQISEIGREALDEQRNNLELTSEEADASKKLRGAQIPIPAASGRGITEFALRDTLPLCS